MTGPQRAKSLVSSIPEGMRSSRRSSSEANLFPSPALCPCRSLSGTQPAAVHLDPFAEAGGFFSVDFAQCQEPVAAEGTETSSPWCTDPCTLAATHLGCVVPRVAPAPRLLPPHWPGGFDKGQAKGGQQGLASFARRSSRWWKTSTSDNALPEQLTSAPGPCRGWGLSWGSCPPVAVPTGSSAALDPPVGSLCCRELELLRPVPVAAAGQHGPGTPGACMSTSGHAACLPSGGGLHVGAPGSSWRSGLCSAGRLWEKARTCPGLWGHFPVPIPGWRGISSLFGGFWLLGHPRGLSLLLPLLGEVGKSTRSHSGECQMLGQLTQP